MKHYIAVVTAIGLATAAVGNAASIPKRDPKFPALNNIFNKNSPVAGTLQNTAANVAGNVQPASQPQQAPVKHRRAIRPAGGGNIGTNLVKGLANGAGNVLPAVLIGGAANHVLSNAQQPSTPQDDSVQTQNQRRQSATIDAQPITAPISIVSSKLAELLEQIQAVSTGNLPSNLPVQKRQAAQPLTAQDAINQLLQIVQQRMDSLPQVQVQKRRRVSDDELNEEKAQALAQLLELMVMSDSDTGVEKREPRILIGPVVSVLTKFFTKQAVQEVAEQAVDAVQTS
ncbi:hypothetical protein QBC38DRAFT_517782 [Podospora fimiseda]|uniref:Uncharacterized protein n=1 Tax=Podospora fimiseda TaxID=252190 RepID=A0AAN7BGV1_9PEZI|nr:hypothetical protein QBC38DRAFT_517782 [Podospora fimiseda]